ncbi:hypothetical protein O181_036474 [Austropuccinia psidii MF-1]|uniref:Uncharacterized protein n=1 Tax=Austropuccinia psidii MF-1 TaxID=1389203 RepID=A0A9Q3D4M3_9BASI|nr:hypothetical protein [Austropuccinia psidii MF-1]
MLINSNIINSFIDKYYKQEAQTPGRKGIQDKGDSSHYPSHRRTNEPDTGYSYSFRITKSKPTRLSSSLTPFRDQNISEQESPLFTIPGTFHTKTRIKREKQDFFQPKAERVRLHVLKSVVLGERS